MSVIREPEGVDLVVARGYLDRQTQLEMAEWLNKYRRTHDQSTHAQEALEIIRQAEQRHRRAANAK